MKKKCPKKYYMGALAVDPYYDYHYIPISYQTNKLTSNTPNIQSCLSPKLNKNQYKYNNSELPK